MTNTLRLAVLAISGAIPLLAQNAPAAARSVLRTEFGDVNVQSLARLDNPWGMATLPDGRVLITEKPGRLRIFANGRLSDPIGGVPKVEYRGQGGLLDVEIDPAFARNRLVYLYYTELAEQQPADARDQGDPRFLNFVDTTEIQLKGGAVARGRLEGSQLRDVQVIWRQMPKTIGRGHFGGRLAFAPDGRLFITSGERMRFDVAQEMSGNLGKVVRINPDGSIPADNPFANRAGQSADVYSVGHRNMYGLAFHPGTRQLWLHEMGPQGGDEINVVVAGKNYGWPVVSNGDNYDGSHIPDHATRKELEQPAHSWTPVVSPSGLIFYSGSRFGAWRGNMLAGGLSSMALLRIVLLNNKVAAVEKIEMGKRIRDVLQAPDGALLLLVDGDSGELLRLTPSPSGPRRFAANGNARR
jgi:glucose/arabinose dehydrogenase